MGELLALGMVIPGAVGVCCTVADRPRRTPIALIASLVMVLAMASEASGVLGSPLLWSFGLFVAAIAQAVVMRIEPGRESRRNHDAHRPLVTFGMAATMFLSGVLHAAGSVGPATGHDHRTGALSIEMLAMGIPVLVTMWLVGFLVTRRASLGRWGVVETACMLAMAASMAMAALLQAH